MSARDLEKLGERKRAEHRHLRGPYPTPEWAPELPAIYARPYTIADQRVLEPYIRDDNPEGWAEVIIRCALDDEGARLFQPRAVGAWLRTRERYSVVSRIAAWIMSNDDEDDRQCPSCGAPLGELGNAHRPGHEDLAEPGESTSSHTGRANNGRGSSSTRPRSGAPRAN